MHKGLHKLQLLKQEPQDTIRYFYSLIVASLLIFILGTIFLWIIEKITAFNPEVDFLSDVATIEAVVIALAVPLSFEIVSRISERYQSDIITNQFLHEREVKWLPYLLIGNILLAVTLRFFVDSTPVSVLWKVFAWLTFLGFLFVATMLCRFFWLLNRYMSSAHFILNRLFNEAEELLE